MNEEQDWLYIYDKICRGFQHSIKNIFPAMQCLKLCNVFNRFTPQSSLVVIYVIVYALIVHTTYSFSKRLENLGANLVLLLCG